MGLNMGTQRIEYLMSELFGFSTQSYFNWKRDASTKRKIINLLDRYFTKYDLEEFLEKGKISRYEVLQEQELVYKFAKHQYFNVLETIGSLGDTVNKDFMDFYFNVLVFSKSNLEHQTMYSPFDIQKSSILYATRNGFSLETHNDELMPKFEAGIELLSHFDCYINQFILANILQDFQPMINTEIDDNAFKIDVSIEAYLHALLFVLYEVHADKSYDEKRIILLALLNEFYSFFRLPTISDRELETISLDAALKKHFDIVKKHFGKLIEAVKKTKETD